VVVMGYFTKAPQTRRGLHRKPPRCLPHPLEANLRPLLCELAPESAASASSPALGGAGTLCDRGLREGATPQDNSPIFELAHTCILC